MFYTYAVLQGHGASAKNYIARKKLLPRTTHEVFKNKMCETLERCKVTDRILTTAGWEMLRQEMN